MARERGSAVAKGLTSGEDRSRTNRTMGWNGSALNIDITSRSAKETQGTLVFGGDDDEGDDDVEDQPGDDLVERGRHTDRPGRALEDGSHLVEHDDRKDR